MPRAPRAPRAAPSAPKSAFKSLTVPPAFRITADAHCVLQKLDDFESGDLAADDVCNQLQFFDLKKKVLHTMGRLTKHMTKKPDESVQSQAVLSKCLAFLDCESEYLLPPSAGIASRPCT
jgi:hypothetical protein